MTKILFICGANIARSQMAEAFYNEMTGTDDAKSAGSSEKAIREHPHPADEVVQVMKEVGIDISEKKTKLVTQEMIDEADRIIVLCNDKTCPVPVKESGKVEFFEFEDPYKKDLDTFRRVRDGIRQKVEELVESTRH